MNRIANAIAALLYDHDAVIIPGLGAFLRREEGAKVNVITNQFERPGASLGFDATRREDNDLVLRYLMAHEGLNEDEARQLLAQFVSDCFARLKEGETVALPEIGTLRFDGELGLILEPVANCDYNGDAFGLTDLNPQPVYGTKPQEDWREQVKRQIKDKNTPMTVAIDHDKEHKGRGWLWVLLLLLLAAAAVWYLWFRPVNTTPKPWSPTPPTPPPTAVDIPDTIKPVTDSLQMEKDTLKLAPDTLKPKVEPVEPEFVPAAYIIGGCFSVEANAMNMVASVQEQGCKDAFVMQRGTMYYVCYGQYATMEETKVALPDIWANYNKKAWILKN